MKKTMLFIALVAMMVLPLFAQGEAEQAASGEFVPTKTIEWYCTSSPGGGSDIFTRAIIDIIKAEGLANGQDIVIQYKTDGAGEVGRNLVSNTKAGKADYTLLTFNSGDLMPMVKNTPNRIEDFTPLSHMAVDKHLIFASPDSKYQSAEQIIAALKAGESMVLGGSKGDDIACHAALSEELGVDQDTFSYIAHDSTGAAITTFLGGHVDLLISKPAAASEYVTAGKIIPVLALSTSRFPGNLSVAPTLSELGYNDVEVPNWRSVVGGANMSDAARDFWSDVFGKVSQTDAWNNDYINKKKLVPDYMDWKEYKAYADKFQADYLSTL
ncbi:MAG: tripartite tricarboxylate transporter substrate binding protein [Sphaerochaetaceae bacterium]|nr:tripartite tricarboxylate transporter substrate binding protein [Sphaerochaetaceae bacterium]